MAGQASLGTTAGTVTITDNDTPNVAPVLAPIPNQVSAPGALSHPVTLSATDANDDPLLYSATVTKIEFHLDQLLNLTIHPQGLFENLYRWRRKVALLTGRDPLAQHAEMVLHPAR